MTSNWFDDFERDPELGDDPLDGIYCPYTNSSKCALAIKGWQPQELCDVLECEQLKFYDRRSKRRNRAA